MWLEDNGYEFRPHENLSYPYVFAIPKNVPENPTLKEYGNGTGYEGDITQMTDRLNNIKRQINEMRNQIKKASIPSTSSSKQTLQTNLQERPSPIIPQQSNISSSKSLFFENMDKKNKLKRKLTDEEKMEFDNIAKSQKIIEQQPITASSSKETTSTSANKTNLEISTPPETESNVSQNNEKEQKQPFNPN